MNRNNTYVTIHLQPKPGHLILTKNYPQHNPQNILYPMQMPTYNKKVNAKIIYPTQFINPLDRKQASNLMLIRQPNCNQQSNGEIRRTAKNKQNILQSTHRYTPMESPQIVRRESGLRENTQHHQFHNRQINMAHSFIYPIKHNISSVHGTPQSKQLYQRKMSQSAQQDNNIENYSPSLIHAKSSKSLNSFNYGDLETQHCISYQKQGACLSQRNISNFSYNQRSENHIEAKQQNLHENMAILSSFTKKSFHGFSDISNNPINLISQFNEEVKKQLKLEDFAIGKLLGKGKFGEVFLARHKTTGYLCALKIISKNIIKEEKVENQIIRQLKIQNFINHPNIVNAYGFFSDSDNIYVMLEFCSGGNLYKQLQKHRRLPEQQVAAIIKQVCQGVKYLHFYRILHRDIKPENIIIQNDNVKICDFGWAVFAGAGLRKTVCGTPLYLSPEIVKGQQYDQRTDIWAIGVLTYQLIIGSIPFKIWSEGQLNKIVQDEVVFPDYVDLSEKAKDFILKILQKDPKNRISVEDLLNHPFIKQTN